MEIIQTKEQIEKRIDEICKQANGVPESARQEIERLITVGYLDGFRDGMAFSQNTLKETFNLK